jgi:hypothetical protein
LGAGFAKGYRSSARELRDARPQQQHQDDPAECRRVEASVEAQAEPNAGQEHRQAEQDQRERAFRNAALGAEPDRRHDEDRDRDRLKHGALLVARPPAQAAPHGRQDAAEPGAAAEQPAQKPDAAIGERRSADRLQRRPQ